MNREDWKPGGIRHHRGGAQGSTRRTLSVGGELIIAL
jgi:hypothetical protein